MAQIAAARRRSIFFAVILLDNGRTSEKAQLVGGGLEPTHDRGHDLLTMRSPDVVAG
jgi:hypothetical protein